MIPHTLVLPSRPPGLEGRSDSRESGCDGVDRAGLNPGPARTAHPTVAGPAPSDARVPIDGFLRQAGLLMRVPPALLAPWLCGQLGGSKGGPSLPPRRPRRLVALEHVAILRRVGRPVGRDLLRSEDRRHRALGHAGPAVDALVGVDVELVF